MDGEEDLGRNAQPGTGEHARIHLRRERREKLVHQLGLLLWTAILRERPQDPFELTCEVACEAFMGGGSVEVTADDNAPVVRGVECFSNPAR